MNTETLLAPTEVWSGKIYSNGWKKPGIGRVDVIEKATGAKLGEAGIGLGQLLQHLRCCVALWRL
jgi:benzaldehyde dehydrogenase (NAD)